MKRAILFLVLTLAVISAPMLLPTQHSRVEAIGGVKAVVRVTGFSYVSGKLWVAFDVIVKDGQSSNDNIEIGAFSSVTETGINSNVKEAARAIAADLLNEIVLTSDVALMAAAGSL